MRSLLIICLLGLVACSSVRERSTPLTLSAEDRAQIVALIRAETDEPIVMLNRDSKDPILVRVNTGMSVKAFTSSGNSFLVKRTRTGWKVVFRGTWISGAGSETNDVPNSIEQAQLFEPRPLPLLYPTLPPRPRENRNSLDLIPADQSHGNDGLGPVEAHLGVLRISRINLSDVDRAEFAAGTRISATSYELYPVPGQASTNRIVSMAAADEKILDEIGQLAGEMVKVEGRRLKGPVHNEKGEVLLDPVQLIVTSIAELEPKLKIGAGDLSLAQAHLLATRIARSHFEYAVGRDAFDNSRPPQLVAGRWVWKWRRGSGLGDVEAKVTFAKDGTSPQFDLLFYGSANSVSR